MDSHRPGSSTPPPEPGDGASAPAPNPAPVPSSTPTPPRSFLVRFLREWGPIALVFGVLYVTGLHTEVFGRLQQLILHTGVFNARADLPDPEALSQAPPAGELIVESSEGDMIHLSDLRGRTVFVNFWATWCPPCIAEMPSIDNLASDLPGDQVVFLMVSLDDNPADARRFMERKGFDLPYHFLRMRDRDSYSITQIPTTYVISPDGRIVYERKGLARYDTRRFRRFLEDVGRMAESPAPSVSLRKSGPPTG